MKLRLSSSASSSPSSLYFMITYLYTLSYYLRMRVVSIVFEFWSAHQQLPLNRAEQKHWIRIMWKMRRLECGVMNHTKKTNTQILKYSAYTSPLEHSFCATRKRICAPSHRMRPNFNSSKVDNFTRLRTSLKFLSN